MAEGHPSNELLYRGKIGLRVFGWLSNAAALLVLAFTVHHWSETMNLIMAGIFGVRIPLFSCRVTTTTSYYTLFGRLF